jgi:hypothetical protein
MIKVPRTKVPSWSWASWDGPVSFLAGSRRNDMLLARDASTELLPPCRNQSSAEGDDVERPAVKLTSYVWKAQRLGTYTPDELRATDAFCPEHETFAQHTSRIYHVALPEVRPKGVRGVVLFDDDAREPETFDCVAISIHHPAKIGLAAVWFLAVQEVAGTDADDVKVYERIGASLRLEDPDLWDAENLFGGHTETTMLVGGTWLRR